MVPRLSAVTESSPDFELLMRGINNDAKKEEEIGPDHDFTIGEIKNKFLNDLRNSEYDLDN